MVTPITRYLGIMCYLWNETILLYVVKNVKIINIH